MTDRNLTISTRGVLDHARAESLAARLRAGVRNGKTEIVIAFDPDAVVASPALPAFLLRASAALRRDGGRLTLTGDAPALDQLRALRIDAALAAEAAPGGGA
jgi:hypothetical protein